MYATSHFLKNLEGKNIYQVNKLSQLKPPLVNSFNKYQTNLESETCAYEDQWRCGSGECISLDQLCDYSSDCIDGSGIR